MTQISSVREESKRRGAKRTIKLPAIAAGATKQYTRDNDKIRSVIREYGAFNAISVLNSDVVPIEIALDFAEGKTYPIPANSAISIDEITYQEFNVTNLSAGSAVTVNKITLTLTYEAPLERERFRSFKMLGGR